MTVERGIRGPGVSPDSRLIRRFYDYLAAEGCGNRSQIARPGFQTWKRLFLLIVAAAFLVSGLPEWDYLSHAARQQHTAACPEASCQSCRHAPAEPVSPQPQPAALIAIRPAPAWLRQLFSKEIFHPPAV